MNPLQIEVWSDIACPWCWVGKRGLEEAISLFAAPVTIRWNAFELNPQAPLELPGPVDYAERLAGKYGTDRNAAQKMIDRIVASGRERGLDLRFDRVRPTNTFDAHRLLSWAKSGSKQSDLKEALFNAYLHEGLLISDPQVLVKLVEGVGLDAGMAADILQSGKYSNEVRADEQRAQQIGVNGVPCFVFPQARFGVSGAQPAGVLLQAMEKARDQQTPAASG